MSDWEDFDADNAAPALAPPRKNKWGEEDESDNSIPDNWDDSENETSEDEKPKQAAVPVSKPKTKMSLAEKIAERQAEREAAKKAAVQGGLESDEDDDGLLSTKERDQLRQVEADMQNTDELFAGLTIKDAEMNKTIVNANPKSQEEFDEFQKALAERIQKYQNNRMYVQFLDKFIRELALPLKDVDVRKFVSTLTALANEKQKASRDMNKSKKKSNKKTAVAAAPKNQLDMNDYSNAYDDYDDFM